MASKGKKLPKNTRRRNRARKTVPASDGEVQQLTREQMTTLITERFPTISASNRECLLTGALLTLSDGRKYVVPTASQDQRATHFLRMTIRGVDPPSEAEELRGILTLMPSIVSYVASVAAAAERQGGLRVRQQEIARKPRRRERTSPMYLAARDFWADPENSDLDGSVERAIERFHASQRLSSAGTEYTWESMRTIFRRARDEPNK